MTNDIDDRDLDELDHDELVARCVSAEAERDERDAAQAREARLLEALGELLGVAMFGAATDSSLYRKQKEAEAKARAALENCDG